MTRATRSVVGGAVLQGFVVEVVEVIVVFEWVWVRALGCPRAVFNVTKPLTKTSRDPHTHVLIILRIG